MKVEYIWMDGTQPTKRLRSKTKILEKASWLDRKAVAATSKTVGRVQTWIPTW